MTASTAYLDALTLIAPGVETEDQLRTALHAIETADFPSDWKATPESIANRSYRRHSPQTLLAIQVAERIAPALTDRAAWVFGSAFGEGETLKIILDALCTPNMAIRPTRFQNSVHNAASGQWTIARSIRSAATSICGGDCTAGSSMLKTLLQIQLEDRPVGMVLFDAPLPYPLSGSHRLTVPAGAGFALSPSKSPKSIAAIEYTLCEAAHSQVSSVFSQKALATDNPVFAILPLIECLFYQGEGDVIIGLNGNLALKLKVQKV
jgi:hypothetical protein